MSEIDEYKQQTIERLSGLYREIMLHDIEEIIDYRGCYVSDCYHKGIDYDVFCRDIDRVARRSGIIEICERFKALTEGYYDHKYGTDKYIKGLIEFFLRIQYLADY